MWKTCVYLQMLMFVNHYRRDTWFDAHLFWRLFCLYRVMLCARSMTSLHAFLFVNNIVLHCQTLRLHYNAVVGVHGKKCALWRTTLYTCDRCLNWSESLTRPLYQVFTYVNKWPTHPFVMGHQSVYSVFIVITHKILINWKNSTSIHSQSLTTI